ncbi:MAG TPA: sulfite exporter TauE/SafE family protein [Candidatus Poseidoniales archaeon]|nr:MAG TPA: sulfite exporter TauE/SafE family protein [Candidatus Poseidoniales archaeon]
MDHGNEAMIELVAIAVATILVAALTVPAGFGLSTMLTPLVLLLMGPHEAVAVIAIVHGAHNAGKFAALKEHVDFSAFKRYGIWLVIGSIFGALLQNQFPQDPLLAIIGVFLVILPLLTMSENWAGYRIPEVNDRFGGFGSGFMGGLSGHQGALRAMFLTRRLPDKMAYAATASILALCVDISRIPVYLIFRYEDIIHYSMLTLVLVFSALVGVGLGKKWLTSLKSEWIQKGVMFSIVVSGIFFIYESNIVL